MDERIKRFTAFSVVPLLLCCFVLGRYLFFSICIVAGIDYGGSSESHLYTYFMSALAAVGYLFFAYRLVVSKIKITHVGILGTMACLFILVALYASHSSYVSTYDLLKYYAVFSLPAFLAGICVGKEGEFGLANLTKCLDILMLAFTAATVLYQLLNLSSGWTSRAYAGMSYQMASYVAALAFGINAFSLADKKAERFSFAARKGYKAFQTILLPIQIVCVFVSGGRGGVVLAALYATVAILMAAKGRGGFLRFFGLVAVVCLVCLAIISAIDWESISQMAGVQRLLSLRDNRSTVYTDAFNLVGDNPLFGYGVGGYYSSLNGYCHNIALDFLLSFGLLGTALIVAVFIAPIYRCAKEVAKSTYGSRLFVLLLFMLCHLMFSSTFMVDTVFWFLFGLALNSCLSGEKESVVPGRANIRRNA